MRITHDNIKIELENESEIEIFWNIIAFALDFEKKENRMTKKELKMANKLYDLTEPKY
jgi:hypothetical protein